GAVHHAMDDGGIVMVGGGNGVHAENGNTQGAALKRDVIDFRGVVVLHRSGDLVKIRSEFLSLEFSHEDFRETRFGSGSASGAVPPFCRVVNGDGGLVYITLALKYCLLQKALVVWIVRYGRQLSYRLQCPQPLDIHVEEAICPGQKACCFRGSAPP